MDYFLVRLIPKNGIRYDLPRLSKEVEVAIDGTDLKIPQCIVVNPKKITDDWRYYLSFSEQIQVQRFKRIVNGEFPFIVSEAEIVPIESFRRVQAN